MKFDYNILNDLGKEYGDSFYLLCSQQFRSNYKEFLSAFRSIFQNTNIAYSYKTNYTPALCSIVNSLGGYAETVSSMEIAVAKKCGVPPSRIIFNGPYKQYDDIKSLLLGGGTVNIDADYELNFVLDIAKKNTDTKINVGLRCNFDLGDGLVSRFGFDINSNFKSALSVILNQKNIIFKILHCHYPARRLDTFAVRINNIIKILKDLKQLPECVSLGGGLFGKMPQFLAAQFEGEIPSYAEYAEVIAQPFKNFCDNIGVDLKLILEPGSALAGDVMKFAAKVINIKNVRGKDIATVAGSMYNINPTLNKKNPPLSVFHCDSGNNSKSYKNLDFGGYTCIESDYLFRGYDGRLAAGDYVVFENVGSYSVVLKPPFILPNFAVIDVDYDSGEMKIVKRRETANDIFQTFLF